MVGRHREQAVMLVSALALCLQIIIKIVQLFFVSCQVIDRGLHTYTGSAMPKEMGNESVCKSVNRSGSNVM